MEIAKLWMEFLAYGLVIGVAGFYLTKVADQFAELTGLGGGWVGAVVLSSITSLPELVSGYSVVRVIGDADLAVGGILGSCLFNLSLFVLLDMLDTQGPVYSRSSRSSLLLSAQGIFLLAYVGFVIVVEDHVSVATLGPISPLTLMIAPFYLLLLRRVRGDEAQLKIERQWNRGLMHQTLMASLKLLAAAALVGFAGYQMGLVSDRIVEAMGWGAAFVGTIFLSIATSLPEIAVTLAAARMGAFELAFGNVLGSNLFNVAILVAHDFNYAKGSLLADVTPVQLVTVLTSLMMTGVVLLGHIDQPKRRFLNRLSISSLLILLLFFVGAYTVFKMG